MKNSELISFATAEQLVDAVADRWLLELTLRAGDPKPYSIALAGGRIVRDLFKAFAAKCETKRSLLENVHFFWSDERCVSPDSSDSNYSTARDYLITPLGLPSQQIHRLPGELPPTEALNKAEAEISQFTSRNDAGLPVVDLVFLGMGEDAHVASLFPQEPESAIAAPGVFRHVSSPKPPPFRITMSYGAICVARQVWVVISGQGKEQALRESLVANSQTPLGRILRNRGHTTLFTSVPL